MDKLRNFICHNQKELIKFEYTISQLHKKFKNIFHNGESSSDEIEKSYEDLIIGSFDMLSDVYESNMEFVNTIFSLNNKKVRFTIKMLLSDKETLIDIYRNHRIDSILNQSSINSNTGFEEILSNKKTYFIANDLEELYLTDKYKNIRLKSNCKESLLNNDIEWHECWKGYKEDTADIDSCYKSTLIIPMSITNTQEDKEKYETFYNKFFNTEEKFIQQRTTWGFFCLDSVDKDYFKELEHELIDVVDYGFIFADILSLYLVFFYNYVISSDTVNEYETTL